MATPGPLIVVPVSILAGRFAGRFGHRPVLMIGAVVSTTESVLFEWTETADRPEFKAISGLIKAMDKNM